MLSAGGGTWEHRGGSGCPRGTNIQDNTNLPTVPFGPFSSQMEKGKARKGKNRDSAQSFSSAAALLSPSAEPGDKDIQLVPVYT